MLPCRINHYHLVLAYLLILHVQDWLNSVSSKQASYHAVAQYYQGMVSKESKEFGEEIARLKVGCLLTLLVVVHVEQEMWDVYCQW